jgi:hypothetical protein
MHFMLIVDTSQADKIVTLLLPGVSAALTTDGRPAVVSHFKSEVRATEPRPQFADLTSILQSKKLFIPVGKQRENDDVRTDRGGEEGDEEAEEP